MHGYIIIEQNLNEYVIQFYSNNIRQPTTHFYSMHGCIMVKRQNSNKLFLGVEFPYVPNTNGIPIVCDMSSSIMTKRIDVSKVNKKIYNC